jgi:hypothetical protein
MSMRSILLGLDAAGVRHVVVGAVAAVAHGSAYVTLDLDLCVDPTPANRDRLVQLLRRWNAYPRGVEPGLPFVLNARALGDVPVLTLSTDEGELDVTERIPGVGGYKAVLAASGPVAVFGVDIRVLSLDALIAAKRATGRLQDRAALIELEALREERKRRGLP